MTATITVRGSHTALFDAERATLSLSAGFQGPDRKDVFARATSLAAEIAALITPHLDADAGPVTRWAADRVHVWSERPWNTEGKRLPLVYHASLGARAEFSDFDVLGRVIEQLAVVEGSRSAASTGISPGRAGTS
ncbi:MAG: SIMPL domain-containing protein [Schumannella sp.]